MQILSDELEQTILTLSAEDRKDWLLLGESEEFPGYWEVDGFDEDFFYDFEGLLGRYRIVSPVRLEAFLATAAEKRYEIAFLDDPQSLLDAHAKLKEPPPFALNSELEGTVQGFLPWQVVGFNKLVRDLTLSAGFAVWDTGSGKAALAAAAIKWHLERGDLDLALVVVKAHNKTDTQRKFKRLADLDAVIVDGLRDKRLRLYEQIEHQLAAGQPVTVITNYEKFREDRGIFEHLLTKRRVYFVWDEAPAKLSHRTTELYAAVKKSLYKNFASKPRPSWMRHLILSATPISIDPDGLYSYINLVRPRLFGTVTRFHAAHVAHRNFHSGKPDRWYDLDKVEAQLDHMTHRVSKADPDVAKLFPEVIPDPRVIDWHPTHRAIYDRFTEAAKELLKEEDSGINALSLIQVLQMLCDAPSMVRESARNREAFSALLRAYGDLDSVDLPTRGPTGSVAALKLLEVVDPSGLTDEGHTKLDLWREIMVEKHPEEKIITHSTWAGYIFPVWEHWLQQWGISYVRYAGTDKQKQTALDAFREDPSIRVFLSGDSGSDSIDIEVASVGVNYNGPWNWDTEKQREGRRDRVSSPHSTIYTYTLAMANSVEDRKREIRDRKYGYHATLFEGRAVEGALSARLTADDLRYMLFGDEDG